MNKIAYWNNIIVQLKDEDIADKETGIILPPTAKRSLLDWEVITSNVVGINKWDTVFFEYSNGIQFEEWETKFRILKEENILAISG